jgi:hypothetical protein
MIHRCVPVVFCAAWLDLSLARMAVAGISNALGVNPYAVKK